MSIYVNWTFLNLFLLLLYSVTNINAKLFFLEEPKDVVASKGASVNMNCVAGGVISPIITWHKDNSPIVMSNKPGWEIISNGSLYIASVSNRHGSDSDAGYYQCIVSEPLIGQIISKGAVLTIAGPPKFTQQPEDLQVYEGEVARFSCSIRGPSSVHIEWFRDGLPLILDSRMTLLPSGALEIHSVSLEDRGEYRCAASNFGRQKVSREASFRVKESFALRDSAAPRFIAEPSRVVARVADNVTFDCAANGYPEPSIIWLKDGSTIDMQNLDSRFVFVGATRSLSISGVRRGDAGLYMCRAENRLDSVDAVAELTVLDMPDFLAEPKDLHVNEKEDVEFECKARGSPVPSVTWFRNGEVIIPNEYIMIERSNTLRILGVITEDAGMYQCLASNAAGQKQAGALLTVSNAAVIESDAGPGVPSAPRHLQPELSSNRFVSLSWHEPEFNNENVVVYSVFYRQQGSLRERMQNVSASSTDNEVDIYRTQLAQLNSNSKYFVRVLAVTAAGVAGRSSPDVPFTTTPDLDLPESPVDLRPVTVSSRSIHVTWGPPPPTKIPVSEYILYYMEVGSAEERNLDISDTSYSLKNLKEFTEYSFWVVAVNSNGAGDPTREVTATTFSASPSAAPSNLTLETVSSKSVIVRWEPPPVPDQNGVITGYKIRYKERGLSKAVTHTTDGKRRLFPLLNLNKATEYIIKLSAMTVNGSGPWTEWTSTKTLSKDKDENRVPGKPSNIKAIPFRNAIEVHWKNPSSEDVVIQGYRIGWGRGIPDEMTDSVESTRRSYTIKDLVPNTEYVITVLAFNNRGPGSPIYEQMRTSLRKKKPAATLLPPVGLKAEALTPFAVSLQWTDTTLGRNQFIGDNGHYNVRYATYASANSPNPRYRYQNFSDVTALIDGLKPATAYEFSVRLVRGFRESPWSLVERASTTDARPQSSPRDITVSSTARDPATVLFKWQPPKLSNGKVTRYLLFYTADSTSEWAVQEAQGGQTSLTLRHLTPSTLYYYKMQAKNDKGFGPFSPTSNFTTAEAAFVGGAGVSRVGSPSLVEESSEVNFMVFVIGGLVGVSCFVLIAIGIFVLYRRVGLRQGSNVDGNRTLTKKKVEVKPPDLWIHHDQLELKNLNKNKNSRSRESALNHIGQEMEIEDKNTTFTSTSTLDRRTPYNTSYMRDNISDDETDKLLNRRSFKPKPFSSISANNPTIGGSTSSSVYSDGTMGRVSYPTPQYPPGISGCHSYTSPHENTCTPHPTGTLGSNDGTGTLTKRNPGNPLRSFSVPAPPVSAPTTPQQPKHIVRPQGLKSPFKKTFAASPSNAAPPSVPLCGRKVLPVSLEDSFAEHEETNENLLHGFSTEELSQEMANLEGLMKDLSAIQANQFNC